MNTQKQEIRFTTQAATIDVWVTADEIRERIGANRCLLSNVDLRHAALMIALDKIDKLSDGKNVAVYGTEMGHNDVTYDRINWEEFSKPEADE